MSYGAAMGDVRGMSWECEEAGAVWSAASGRMLFECETFDSLRLC